MHHRRALGALVVVALAVLTAGCTTDPGTTPTTDPRTSTAEPAELTPNPQLAAEREAIQRLKDFYAAADQLGHAGYDDSSPITWFLAGDYTMAYLDEVGALRSQGAVQVGVPGRTNIKVVDHHVVEDPFYDDQLTIEVCTDTTDADVLLPDGSSAVPPGRKGRFVATVTMWHETDRDTWVIASYLTDGGRSC